jgi:poly-beta-hydroxyalkanoate depolymerase
VSDNTFAQSVAERLTNRYSTPKFNVVELAISAKIVKQQADDSAESFWRNLLSIQKGLWQKTTITWTGSGASAQTVTCVIKGRTINVTPENTDVSLFFGDWVDNHSFILDTDKLDIDRLG